MEGTANARCAVKAPTPLKPCVFPVARVGLTTLQRHRAEAVRADATGPDTFLNPAAFDYSHHGCRKSTARFARIAAAVHTAGLKKCEDRLATDTFNGVCRMG
jgi:hypothetical protein